MKRNVIAKNILLRAKDIAVTQGYLPKSPCYVHPNKKVDLCAAACLAYAGLESLSKDYSQNFLNDLVSNSGSDILLEAYKVLNWPTDICEDLRVENDSTSSDLRVSTFLTSCDKLIG